MTHELRVKERGKRSYAALKYTMVVTGEYYGSDGTMLPVGTGHEATESMRITKRSKLRYIK